MFHPALEAIRSDDFFVRYGYVAGTTALRRLLYSAGDVIRLKTALRQREIADEELSRFVSVILDSWRPAEHFGFDLSLAALAVAVELRSTPFVNEFLEDLAKIKRVEFHRSATIAKATLLHRQELVPALKSITVCWKPMPLPAHRWELVSVVPSSLGGQTEGTITMGAT